MDLENFVEECKSRAIEEGNDHYLKSAACNLGKKDYEKIMSYAKETIEKYFDFFCIKDNFSRLRTIDCFMDEASKELNEDYEKNKIFDFKKITIGCLTTIGEKIQYRFYKDDLKEDIADFLYFDVPEGLDFAGILAGSVERTAYFRFIKEKENVSEVPEAGRPGFNAGHHGINVHIASDQK